MTEALYGFFRRKKPMKERFYANQNVSQLFPLVTKVVQTSHSLSKAGGTSWV